MKKVFLFLIVSVALFVCPLAVSARNNSANSQKVLRLLQNATSVASLGDTLFFVADGQLYSWTDSGQAAIQAENIGNVWLLSDGSHLYYLDLEQGSLRRWNGKDFVLYAKIDLPEIESDGKAKSYVLNAVLTEHYLCLLVDNADTQSREIHIISMQDGQTSVIYQGQYLNLSAMDGDKLLVADGLQTVEIKQLVLSGKQWDHFAQAGELRPRSMYYDQTKQTLYFAAEQLLYSVQKSKAPKAILKVAVSETGMYSVVFADHYLENNRLSAHVLLSDPFSNDSKANTLVVGGGFWGDREQSPSFSALQPGVALQYEEQNFNSSEFVARFIAGEYKADVYVISTNTKSYRGIIEKGYALPLNSEKIISQLVERIHPVFHPALRGKDGQIYSVPQQVPVADFLYGCYVENWENAGLGEMPQTIIELMDACVTIADKPDWLLWADQDAEGHIKSMLNLMIDTYVNHQLAQGNMLRMDTPLFHQLIDKFEQTRSALEVLGQRAEDMQSNRGEDGLGLLPYTLLTYPSWPLLPTTEDYHQRIVLPMLLTIQPGENPIISTSMPVVMVNALSSNKQLAIDYIKCQIADWDAEMRLAFLKEGAKPVEDIYYAEDRAGALAEIDNLQKSLINAEANGSSTHEIKDLLQQQQAKLTQLEASRWYIPPASVKTYLELLPWLKMYDHRGVNFTSGGTMNLMGLLNQYVAGAIDADHFIKQYDQMVMLMELEEN